MHTVYLSALDASKAFDNVNHSKLFDKLAKRSIPQCIIQILHNWYGKLVSAVKWNGVLSHYFSVSCGIRQGGVLSPLLFNIYVDGLIDDLEASNAGCCVCGRFFGCIMYADDLLLLSASVFGLQHMLDICHRFGMLNDIRFNDSKSVCVKVGPHWNRQVAPMTLGNTNLCWTSSFKYLGVHFLSGLLLKVDISSISLSLLQAGNPSGEGSATRVLRLHSALFSTSIRSSRKSSMLYSTTSIHLFLCLPYSVVHVHLHPRFS